MECPHCQAELTTKPHVFALGIDQDGTWQVSSARCQVCDRLVVTLCTKEGCTYPAWPVSSTRARLSEDVPVEYSDDYHTAAQVIFLSPEASAAISRRSLHSFLANQVHAGHGALADQIRQATLAPDLPAYAKQALRKLNQVAKLEPDTVKSLHPEALCPVEPGEAEWLLDILQSLYDLYFVEPARMQRKQDALEESIALSESSAQLASPPTPTAPLEPAPSATAETQSDGAPSSASEAAGAAPNAAAGAPSNPAGSPAATSSADS